MLGVTKTWDRLFGGAQRCNAGDSAFMCRQAVDVDCGHALGVEAASDFGAPQHDTATSEQAGGDGAMKRLGRGRQGHPRGNDAWHKTMFGDRAKNGIGEQFLLLVGHAPRHEKPEIAGKVDFADDLVAQVMAAHGDAGRIRCADRGKGLILFADAHCLPHFSIDEVDFGIRRMYFAVKLWF